MSTDSMSTNLLPKHDDEQFRKLVDQLGYSAVLQELRRESQGEPFGIRVRRQLDARFHNAIGVAEHMAGRRTDRSGAPFAPAAPRVTHRERSLLLALVVRYGFARLFNTLHAYLTEQHLGRRNDADGMGRWIEEERSELWGLRSFFLEHTALVAAKRAKKAK